MAKGRPPDLLLDPDNPGPVVQAVVHVDERGRFQLPSKLIGGWITKAATTYALAVLTEPGKVRLHPWDDAGELVLRKRRELIQQAATDFAAMELLRALEDRYKRFQIPLGARPTLTPEMISHLGLVPLASVPIYAWRIQNVVELNSASYRAKELEVDWEDFRELPH
jgi:hypothetical protein